MQALGRQGIHTHDMCTFIYTQKLKKYSKRLRSKRSMEGFQEEVTLQRVCKAKGSEGR